MKILFLTNDNKHKQILNNLLVLESFSNYSISNKFEQHQFDLVFYDKTIDKPSPESLFFEIGEKTKNCLNIPYPIDIKTYGVNVPIPKRKNQILFLGDFDKNFQISIDKHISSDIEKIYLTDKDYKNLNEFQLNDLYNEILVIYSMEKKYIFDMINASFCGATPFFVDKLPVAKFVEINENIQDNMDILNYFNIDKKYYEEVAKLNHRILSLNTISKVSKMFSLQIEKLKWSNKGLNFI